MLRKIFTLLTLAGCWSTLAFAQSDSIVRRIILIGDAGELHQDGRNPVVDAVRQRYNLQDARNTVLFLGDNIYPYGLPDESDRRYPQSKEIIDYQINLVRNTAAQAIFIPGNHDWQKMKPNGWRTIRNQQQYVDSLNLPNVRFLPKEGCPGPEEVPLDDNITLIVMDTEWWLFPFDKPGLNSACDCKTKDEVLTTLSDIVGRNRNKLILFASHHPLRSYGIHGGYYTIKQHIFPFTDLRPYLYIPLPVLGSIYPLARGVFGAREDIPHPEYQQMIEGIEKAFAPHGSTVFVSGHDHALQFIKDEPNYYVVSGSGAKHDRVKKGKKSLFATKGNGFAALELLQDGTFRVQYYLADNLQQPAYASRVLNIQDIKSAAARESTPASSLPPVLTLPADTQYNHAGSFHRWWLGSNYRQVWATPVPFKVFDMQKEQGGLKILKRGGGLQTRSLRLEDKQGREWVLRSLKKDPTEAVPEELRETFAIDIVQDQISSSNPYGPLPVAALAEAAGVPHANPSFVYLPKDTVLGIYEHDFGGDVYLFEEREPGNNPKTYNTEKALEQVQGDNDNSIDQQAVLKARLLDMLVGDWDRHDDQWRWGVRKEDKAKTYFPIPRDRDQAFFVNEGVVPWLASRAWLMPKFQGFKDNFPNINGFNFNARYFDRSFLHALNEDQWRQQAHSLVQQMTDNVLQDAVNQFPAPIRAQVGDETLRKLRNRRGVLEQEALRYYRFLAKAVDIPGTKKDELFSVQKLPDGKLAVNAFKISKKGEIEQNIYSRTFDPADTKEIRLFGLGGKDRFTVSGDHRSPIRIRLIGGRDSDTYIDSSSAGKRVRIYDLRDGKDSFALHGPSKRLLSHSPDVIRYDRMSFKYNRLMPLVTAAYNLDDGLLLGLGFQYTGHGFRKEPFAVKHTLTAAHSLATRAYQFRYLGEFTNVVGNTDLMLFANARAPHNTINFFGLGNQTVFDKSGGRTIQYYRSRYNMYHAEALLKSKLGARIQLGYGPTFDYYALDKDENRDRYISKFPDNGLDSAAVYTDKYYTGAKLSLQIDTRNNDMLPTRGMLWTTTLHGNQGVNQDKHNYLQLQSDMSIYTSFRIPASLVLVTRFGGGTIWGHYEFFQAMMLGGTQNLRGYRNYRFAGRSMVYNNTELRLKLFQFSSYLFPASVGLIAFNDVGRVWHTGEKSGRWHDGYGGGFYFTPVNMFIITAVVGKSEEETLPYITFGFKF